MKCHADFLTVMNAKPTVLKDMSPTAKAFLIGMFLGAAFGTFYTIFEILGSENIGKLSS